MIDQNVNIPVSTVFDRPRQILRSMRWVTSAFAYPEILQRQLVFAGIDAKKSYSGAHDTWTRQGR